MAPKVMLWAPAGSGEHYNGPGSFAYRLYSSAAPGRVSVELAHSAQRQANYPLFAAQHRIAPSPGGALGLARFLWNSRRWLKRHAQRFDVMHALAGFHSSVVPAWHAQKLGLPTVLFVANHGVEFVDRPGLRGMLQLARRRREMIRDLSAVIAMSRAIHDELVGCGVDERRIARIPMAVDTQRFHPVRDAAERAAIRKELGLRNMPTLIFVGSVVRRKRPHLLVEAIGRLHSTGHDCQLILAGPEAEPEYAATLKAEAQARGVHDLIKWTGHVSRIEQWLRAADFFSLPSAIEGMPAALAEAMSTGLPPVTTRISGCEDLVDHGSNGFLVEPDASVIADTLRGYLRDERLAAAHGARARERILATCSSQEVLAAHFSLFEAVRAGRDAASASIAAAW